MRFALFYHSLVSDWNHGNAHFLRGVATELIERGHDVEIYEPAQGWSRRHLLAELGHAPLEAFHSMYPRLSSTLYDLASFDLDAALDPADVVIVHEWNAPALVAAIGRRRSAGQRFRLLFHDTHHRAVSAPRELSAYDLSHYDGVLAFGEVLRGLYERRGWAQRAWTWHEAADTRVFRPLAVERRVWDVVWVGNWGDGERTRELEEFLIDPVHALELHHRIPLVSAPWRDEEGLFEPGDFLVAPDGAAMQAHLERLIDDPVYAEDVASQGHRTVLARHTCAHRADELLAICRQLRAGERRAA